MSSIILNPDADSVAVALDILEVGVSVGSTVTKTRIPKHHKVALRDIAVNEPVIKYGHVIGYATEDIPAGTWVHSHNLHIGDLENYSRESHRPAPATNLPPVADRYFLGYRDARGRAATRNYILIASTVDCSAHTVDLAVEELNKRREWYRRRYPNVDGIVGLTHNSGCGLVELSPAHQRENLTMRNLIDHPNVGGRVLVELGCEKSQADLIVGTDRVVKLESSVGHADGQAVGHADVPVLTMQERGGTWKSVEQIVDYVDRVLIPEANARRRTLIPAAELIVATQCGGSDAASGFTANPAIGWASDMLVRCGAASFLSETTETFGAEAAIIGRASSQEVADKYLRFVSEYEAYLATGHGTAQNNVSHGNRLGGLTTIAEKSLGAVAKAGTAPFSWVCDYGERVPGPGLGFMNGPAYDPPSATGQTAGGAIVGVFSTGRGSCFGGILVPWIKVVSNTETYERIDDMEINAGRIADGTSSIADVGREIFEMVCAVASGAQTYSEKADYSVVNIWNSGAIT